MCQLPVYKSLLCDSDPKLYEAYLAVVKHVADARGHADAFGGFAPSLGCGLLLPGRNDSTGGASVGNVPKSCCCMGHSGGYASITPVASCLSAAKFDDFTRYKIECLDGASSVVDDSAGGNIEAVGVVDTNGGGGAGSGVEGSVCNCAPVNASRLNHVVVESDLDGQCGVDRANQRVSVVGVGANLERNRIWRAQRKARKQFRQSQGLTRSQRSANWRVKENESVVHRGAFDGCSDDVRKQLVDTRAACLIAKNKLACAKAQRQEELLLAQDVEKLKKRNETKVMRETEVNKVAVEKAFGTLAATGNVSSSDTTSGSGIRSGTISPNSSISEAEVRKLQKDVIDTMKNNDALVRRMEQIEIEARHGTLESVRKVLDTYCDAVYAKSAGITVDEDGEPVCGTGSIYEGYTDDRGRFHFGQKYTDDFFY